MRIKCGFGFQFYSNLILIEVGLQIATVPELPAPAFASTPQRTMMTKRIENPAAVHGRQNQAKPWRPLDFLSQLPGSRSRKANGQRLTVNVSIP